MSNVLYSRDASNGGDCATTTSDTQKELKGYEEKLKCLIKPRNLPPAPKPTKSVRVYTKSEMNVPKRFEDENMSLHPARNGRESWTKAETKAALELWEEGNAVEDIAKMLGRTTGSVEGKINRERGKGKTARRRAGNWTDKDTDMLMSLLEAGKKYSEIAKEMHVSISTIQKHLRKEKK